MSSEPRLLVIDPSPGPHLDELRRACAPSDVAICSALDAIEEAVQRHDPTIMLQFRMAGFSGVAATRCVTQAPNLRWLHYAGVGIDHLAPWDPERLTVTNSAGVTSDFMAEYVMAALLSANIGFPLYHQQQSERLWAVHRWVGVKGRTLAIIGLGRIGLAVAERARAFGMTIIGVRSDARETPFVDAVFGTDQIADALADADFVSVHVPLTARTRGMIDGAVLDRLKPSAVLIDTSRGGVVDEAALVARLRAGKLRAVVRDVFAREPLPRDDELWTVPNLVITPHMSDSVADWKSRSVEFFLSLFADFRAGGELMNVVSPARGY
jgi:phosphoglycerate dehydrogenase-like enzyme